MTWESLQRQELVHISLMLVLHAFSWVILGALLTWGLSLKESWVQKALRRFVLQVTFPIFIFTTILGHFPRVSGSTMVAYVASGVAMVGLSYALSLIFQRLAGIRSDAGSYHLANSIHNYGFIAYTVVEVLFGLAVLAQMFVLVVTLELILWTWGVRLLQGRGRPLWRVLLTAPLLSLCAGLFFRFATNLHLEEFAPGSWAMEAGRWAVPMALTCLGGVLYHTLKKTGWSGLRSREVVSCLLLRHLAFPLLALAMLHFGMPDGDLKNVLLVQSIMPMAMMPMAMMVIFGREYQRMGLAIAVSNLVSLVLIPLWILIMKASDIMA